MNRKKINIAINKLAKYFGIPYDYKSNLASILDVLIATKLSQNTTDKSSYSAFKNLKSTFSSWEEVAQADLNEIKQCIQVCGLANTKAKDIKSMLSKLIEKYGNLDLLFLKELKNEEIYKEFIQYEGFGYKTISCMLIFALGRDVFPVDTHIHRVLNRLGIVKTNTPEKTYHEIKDQIPEGKKYEFHSNLIKFGRNICQAKFPFCNICFLYNDCEFELKEFFRNQKTSNKVGKNNFIILENI